jgi:DNA-binding LacI/PurR family transcriptional regulator
MISMKDIAKMCGVSVATVSKALNDYSDIGESTKKRIREVAENAGYFPNSSARALKTNRTYNLGVLFVDDAQSGLTHDFFAAVLDSFKVRAEEHGYDITFTNCNVSNRKMTYYEHCRYRGVDGVAIACIDFYNPDVQELIYSDLPVITIDHLFDSRAAVMSDNVRGMEDLVNYVYSMGHRRVAYIHGADSSVSRNRIGSFLRAMSKKGIEIPDEYLKPSQYRDTVSAKEMTHQLLNLPIPPTCIFYPDDFAALGGINAIKERGLRIPEDISIAGYDGILLTSVLEPRLTTIKQDTTEIGRVAADKLISQIENPRIELVEHILVKGQLIEGESVAKID